MSKEKPVAAPVGDRIYDARTLGKPRMFLLGLQFAFAMFSGNVVVGLLTGLPIDTTIFFAGIATLLCHAICKGKTPVFLGGSFALLVGYQIMAPNFEPKLLMYAAAGMVVLGFVYVLVGQLIRIDTPPLELACDDPHIALRADDVFADRRQRLNVDEKKDTGSLIQFG